ncbi:MAG TPA: hypothetical protein VFA68_01615 [Terriglobales bacterium]|nr:hypothetical protein [Terriglobales bacterium]
MFKLTFLAILCLAANATVFAQTFSCPAGSEDMMQYFAMGYPNRLASYMGPGNANPIYTTVVPDLGAGFAASGYFVWTKSALGYPWDVKSFDTNYVYDRTTELGWTDPTSFKRFSTDLPMSRRCVPMGKAAAPVKIASSRTNYNSYANCQSTQTQSLGYVVNSVSAPVQVNTGGNLGTVSTRYFRYQYTCDSSYGNCAYMEVFSLGYQIGLYDWKYYQNQSGKWVQVQESVINQLDGGQATPYLPCPNSYQ